MSGIGTNYEEKASLHNSHYSLHILSGSLTSQTSADELNVESSEKLSIPKVYGALKPTAVFIPLHEILKDYNFELMIREIFGLFQIITDYKQDELQMVLDACERMHAHLTTEVISNDPLFLQNVLRRLVNGTTYAGIKARKTGAPQNHWFGPSSDPRGAGIGTPEAIKLVWSCHREIIFDIGPFPMHWEFHLEDKVAFWAAGNDTNQSVRTNVEEPVRSIPPVRYVRRKVLKSHKPRKMNEVQLMLKKEGDYLNAKKGRRLLLGC